MYALKREAILNRIYPKRFTIPAMARSFYDTVKQTGRSNEVALLMRYYFRTNLFSAISYVGVGLKLLKTGRLVIFEKKMKGIHDFKKMLEISEKK